MVFIYIFIAICFFNHTDRALDKLVKAFYLTLYIGAKPILLRGNSHFEGV